ncbi:hypothetical protein [Falsiroseomonas sp.]|uniref:hypothetical protein n=1 Tax=Falsiroseomonas sp. TaxID=2870721 RepID=UPI00271C835B|nr:hypothetical protein [Falsiroseomonas sp.]MDO9503195.1 hypothetical protein [Falsiroseomonas sp.]
MKEIKFDIEGRTGMTGMSSSYNPELFEVHVTEFTMPTGEVVRIQSSGVPVPAPTPSAPAK